MNLSSLIDRTMLISGQYLLSNLEPLSLNKDMFFVIVDESLRLLEGYVPQIKNLNIETSSELFYVFTEEFDKFVPEWISNVIPIGYSGIDIPFSAFGLVTFTEHSYWANQQLKNGRTGASCDQPVSCPRKFVFQYEKPKLYLTESGAFDVTAITRYGVVKTFDESNKLLDVQISGIKNEFQEIFLDLILSKFLIVIGRSRRAFNLSELPISSDASELVSEGQELYEKTVEKLIGRSSWYTAIQF